MTLKLDKPIVALDLESTSLSVSEARIVSIGMVKLFPNGEKEEFTGTVNPCMKIPVEATDIHGITDEMVKGAPIFASLAPSLSLFLEGCNLTGHNIEGFDLPLLEAEYRRSPIDFPDIERIVDTLKIFRQLVPHTLEGAIDFHCPEIKQDHIAHNALSDAKMVLEILGQQAAYIHEDSIDELIKFGMPEDWATSCGKIRWRKDKKTLYINFGKHAGTDLEKTNIGYLKWIINNEFPADVKVLCQQALKNQGF